jgi:hypothetical protein
MPCGRFPVAGFFVPGRLAGCAKKGAEAPGGLNPAARGAKAPSEGERAAAGTSDRRPARERWNRTRSEREHLAPDNEPTPRPKRRARKEAQPHRQPGDHHKAAPGLGKKTSQPAGRREHQPAAKGGQRRRARRTQRTSAGTGSERNETSRAKRARRQRRETHGEKSQLGKGRTNTERHCQRAPKGLTGREAEAQAGADAPEGGVQAAQADARNGQKRGPLRMFL